VVNVDRYYNVDGVEFGKLTAWDGKFLDRQLVTRAMGLVVRGSSGHAG
jgi:hypothetical protein